ncbi:MAG: type II secretion system protein N [Desulfohalobiaceae bacterium]
MRWTNSANLVRGIPARFMSEGILRHAWYGLLLAVIVFLAVLSSMSWLEQELTPPVRANVEAGEKNSRSSSSSVEESERSRPLQEYEQDIAGDLFGSQPEEEEDSESGVSLEEIPLSEKDLGLELMGTIVGNDSEQNIAIIEDTRKNEQDMYREGDRIRNVTIQKILRDNVVIVQSDEQKILTMQYEKLRDEDVASGDRKVASRSRESTDRERSISRDYVTQSLQNMSKLMQDALIKPYMESGETKGFQLDNIRSGSFYDRIGLRNKDVILQVDGKNLQSPQQMMEFTQKLSSKDRVELTIQRNGQKRNISYSLQ